MSVDEAPNFSYFKLIIFVMGISPIAEACIPPSSR